MEYVDGERLRDRLNRVGRLSVDQALDITRQIIDGLEEAHAQDVVHRDLKPENVMITADGTVKVMDFGVARSLSPDAVTVSGSLSGTPAYMSPEQALGQAADLRSDIYSLGLILHEMVCGRRVFEGDSAVSIAMKQVSDTPRSPQALVPGVPAFVSDAIMRCLNKRREERYASVDELRRALDGEAAMVAAPRLRRRGRLAVAAVLVSIATAFAIVAVTAGLPQLSPTAPPSAPAEVNQTPAPPSRGREPRDPSLPAVAVLDFTDLQGDARYAGFQGGIAEALTASLANTRRFRVVERTQLDRVLKELELNRTGAVDPATAQAVGRLIGAQYLVLGSYQVFQGQIVINARLLRVETGEILETKKIAGSASGALALPEKLAAQFLSPSP
jgi:TolB-like protein